MASSKIDKRKIDELIWGNLESEIMEAKYSLYAASDVIKSAKVYPVKLLIGFLDFIHYRCREWKPELNGNEKVEFDAIGGDFDDRSSWVKFLDFVVDKVLDDPYFVREFVDQDGDEHKVFVLMDTFSLFECGMILNRTRLEGEAKFSSAEISKEFHVDEKKLPRMLSYFKYLNDAERASAHTLVLRPTKLAKMLYWLDDKLRTLVNYPEQVLRTEEWEEAKDRFGTLLQGLYNEKICNEENFQELLKARSIETPNAQFLTFYEYIRDILTPEAAKEWEDIRDRYIAESKKVLKWATPGLTEEDLDRAKASLGKARKAFEDERYVESVILSYKSMEEALSEMIKQDMRLAEKIDVATRAHPDLRKHREGLHFIRTARNALAHASGVDECDEDSAKFALDKMDQFLIDIANSLRSQRLDGMESNHNTESSSWTWYLLPCFLSIVGGAIAFFALRNSDRRTAKNCLNIGIVHGIVSIVPTIAIIAFSVGEFLTLP